MTLIEQYVEERNAMLRAPSAARYLAFSKRWTLPLPTTNLGMWGAIHKARLELPALADLHTASITWLRAHNMTRFSGLPL